MPATIYVISGKIGAEDYLTNARLFELRDNGWEIGSHSVTHPHLAFEPDSVVIWELRESYEQLADSGHVAVSFCTPSARWWISRT
jgi:peptidoglycan/xylan/chitin deacetylase (PgdA/CDA1 family)